ncbi:MAG: hypothetical protein A3C53_01765 [Omnitrophica WOR_2 bacterium RIFCSPHIGHO2_02_FULL_68_15]|nr:MAG: hypothetical protein A3C53_01765 [Omnitrophica WOR_2 bacterium RIFCSPHIGHO2_02_FULL_68_15]
MLKVIRKRLKLILWTLVISFILWEIGAVLSNRQSPSVYAGTLYGRPVPVQDFQAALTQVRQYALLTYGDRAAQALPPEALVEQAWDLLLLSRAAQRAGVRANDREVVEELGRWPLFQRNGQFDLRTYRQVVQYGLGTSPRVFEEGVRRRLAIQRLMDRAVGTPTVGDDELRAAWRAEHDEARVAYLRLDPAAFTTAAAPDEAAVHAHYQSHAADFSSDPKVQIRYLAVVPAAFEPDIVIGEADILEEYLRQVLPEMRGSWPTSDRRDAIRKQLVTAKTRELAADIAWELRDRGRQAPDLAALGALHHLTPQEPPPFTVVEEIAGVASSRTVAMTAFNLPAGELSQVVETPEAYYLLTVVKKIPSRPLTLEEAAPQIRQQLQDDTARRLAQERAENLFATAQELALANTKNPLAVVARSAGLSLTTTEFVTSLSPMGALGTAGALLGPAFTLEPGRLHAPWQTAHGWVLAQLLERRPLDEEAFAKAEDGLRAQLLERKRTDAMSRWMLALRAEGKPSPNPQYAAGPGV